MAEGQGAREYTETVIGRLELLWGDGYLSPGGAAGVDAALQGVDLTGQEVLDLGCGTGGPTLKMITDYGARSVIGFDIEAEVLNRARARAEAAGLTDRLSFRRNTPGPLPVADASVDVIFSKDAIVHVSDKAALYRDLFRILRPGGLFVASDWLKGEDQPYSDDMQAWHATHPFDFKMASVAKTKQLLSEAGFVDVSIKRRADWYAAEVRREREQLKGEMKAQALELFGRQELDRWVEAKSLAAVVLDTGEFCPAHMKATKPG